MVSNADTQRTTGAALTDDDGDDGHSKARHDDQVFRDGHGLSPFFRPNPGKRALGVDESDDWQFQHFGKFHFDFSFAVAFGVGHAEIS